MFQRGLHASSRIWFHGRNANKIDRFLKNILFYFLNSTKKAKKYINRMKMLPSGGEESEFILHNTTRGQQQMLVIGEMKKICNSI